MITSSLTLNKYNLSFTIIDLFIMVLRVTAREKKKLGRKWRAGIRQAKEQRNIMVQMKFEGTV